MPCRRDFLFLRFSLRIEAMSLFAATAENNDFTLGISAERFQRIIKNV